MNNRFVINFTPGATTLHKLNGFTKLLLFIVLTAVVIAAFDIRVHAAMCVVCLAAIFSMKPNWKPILMMLAFLFFVVGLWGTFLLFFIAPEAGLRYIGQETLIIRFNGYLYLTEEFLWYALSMFFKRLASLMSVMVFILSVTPSELAAGLNALGLPYKICVLISLGFRTIPGVARDFVDISNSMQMRGTEMSGKASVFTRLKQVFMLLVPLLITSFGKVESIANAMDLRGFGLGKRKSWYSEHPPAKADYVVRAVTLFILLLGIAYVIYFRVLHPFPARYWYWNIS